MATSRDSPRPSWLVQEPEGPGAPRTPGRWKCMWASDWTRLEEAHHKGDAEVLVYGRKYVVDMKERTVRPLYWDDKPAFRPVIRATYFVQQGHSWLPYSEKDSELLETNYAAGKLRNKSCPEVEVPLADGENKVVLTRRNSGEPVGDFYEHFHVAFHQKPLKDPFRVPPLLAGTFDSHKVHRGSPEPGRWGGVLATKEDMPLEAEPPKHLVFVVHGMGESLWTKSSSVMHSAATSVRASTGPMRATSAKLLLEDRRKREALGPEKSSGRAPVSGVNPMVGSESGPIAGEGEGHSAGTVGGEELGGTEAAQIRIATAVQGEGESAGFVEFLPVEWFNEVHGEDAVSQRLVERITLPTLGAFRDFTNEAIADVMYYLTPKTQAAILAVVGNKMNAMWKEFARWNPGFNGKVSVMGHSLGSIITHDILMAQPVKGQTGLAEGAVSQDIPVLSFSPEMLLVCGSPIGMFLSIRQAEGEHLFKFNTTNRFFNLFHPMDPVAYRLEPLVDAGLRNVEPKQVPHRGGDRTHVVVKKFREEVNARFRELTSQKGYGWESIRNFTQKKPAMDDPGCKALGEPIAPSEVDPTERIDWVMQESTLEGMHPWASAMFAHNCYFSNVDLMTFLLNRLSEAQEEEGRREEEQGTIEVVESVGGS